MSVLRKTVSLPTKQSKQRKIWPMYVSIHAHTHLLTHTLQMQHTQAQSTSADAMYQTMARDPNAAVQVAQSNRSQYKQAMASRAASIGGPAMQSLVAPAFGASVAGSTSTAFGNTSAFGQPAASTASSSGFGQAAKPATAFGQSLPTSAFGSASSNPPPASTVSAFGQAARPPPAFGQPSAFGASSSAFSQTPKPVTAFGPTAQPTTAFGQTAQPSAFGQAAKPSTAFGQTAQPSAFGQATQAAPSTSTSTLSAFGQAAPSSVFSQTSGPSAFGQSSAFGQPSAFGQAVRPPATGFGTTNHGAFSAFGQTAQPLSSVFGSTSQPGSAFNPSNPAPSAFSGTTASQKSAFGPTTPATTFGPAGQSDVTAAGMTSAFAAGTSVGGSHVVTDVYESERVKEAQLPADVLSSFQAEQFEWAMIPAVEPPSTLCT